ncbi:hypothetical protein RJ55_01655 [Drechmeria coniospora]|nr:hypothetical protein RJ55_01655 [Drechmeria coniospora]
MTLRRTRRSAYSLLRDDLLIVVICQHPSPVGPAQATKYLRFYLSQGPMKATGGYHLSGGTAGLINAHRLSRQDQLRHLLYPGLLARNGKPTRTETCFGYKASSGACFTIQLQRRKTEFSCPKTVCLCQPETDKNEAKV